MRNLGDINDDGVYSLRKTIPDNFDIREYLTNKEIEFYERTSSVSGTWLRMKCPFPEHDDSRPSFNINAESLAWNCYVCGKGSWYSLCEKLNWGDWDDETVLIGHTPNSEWREHKKKLNAVSGIDKEVFIAEQPKLKKIKKGDKFYKYLQDRNISKAIKHFGMRCCSGYDDFYNFIYSNRIVIPVYDESGENILWYEGRTIKEKVNPKYYRPEGCEKTKLLFNYHNVIKSGSRKVIVVEGILDVIQLWLWGYQAVCIFGASISVEQMELLMVFDEVYICLDIDKAGITGFNLFRELSDGSGLKLKRIIIPRGYDPNKLERRKFDKYYGRALIVNDNNTFYATANKN